MDKLATVARKERAPKEVPLGGAPKEVTLGGSAFRGVTLI